MLEQPPKTRPAAANGSHHPTLLFNVDFFIILSTAVDGPDIHRVHRLSKDLDDWEIIPG
jgi:hypothetical protein